MAFKFRWAFGDKDVEELIVEELLDAGNADVTRTFEWGVKLEDATTGRFCRNVFKSACLYCTSWLTLLPER